MPGGAPQQFNPVPLPPQAPSPYEQIPAQAPAYTQQQMVPPQQQQAPHPSILRNVYQSLGGARGIMNDLEGAYHAVGGFKGLEGLINMIRGK